MTSSSMQIGSDESTAGAGAQGTILNRLPAMVTAAPVGVFWGRWTLTPSTEMSCMIIDAPVASLIRCRSYETLPDALVRRHISPSGFVSLAVGYCLPLTVKYHFPP